VVPWVVLGYVLMALYYSPTNLLTITEGQSQIVGVATAIGAVMNIGLNIVFIPVIGIYGAAITTTVTYLVMFVGVYLIASRRYSVPLERRRLALIFSAALITFGLGWIAAPEDVVGGILVKMGWLIAFPLILWEMGFLREKERQFLRQFLKRVRN
jgi:O-antigen/teichoic acid export membrane protein